MNATINPPDAPDTPSGRRILLIEDHEDARKSLALLLRLSGHEVATAESGQEGLSIARSILPEIILVDIGLPDMSGHEAAQQLRVALGAQVRLIALSGFSPSDQSTSTAFADFDAYLVKPVDLATLRRVL